MNTVQEIGYRLRAEVEKRFRTQREFAEAMTAVAGKEITESSVSDYIRGRSRPGKIMLERLAAMEFDIDFILTGRKATTRNTALVKGRELIRLELPTDASHVIHDITFEAGIIRVSVFSAVPAQGALPEDTVEILAYRKPVKEHIELKAAATPIQP